VRTTSAVDTRPTVLVVNHNRTDRCGVYQMGKAIADILQGSEKYRFVGVRCDSYDDFWRCYMTHCPSLCIYNYYPGTLDWCVHALNWPCVSDLPGAPEQCVHVGMAHEVTHADAHTPRPPFKRWIVTDPSFPASDIYFKTVRPLPTYKGSAAPPADRLTIGSFGYAFPNKGFERLLSAVMREFGEDVRLRYHVTVPHFDGGMGTAYLEFLKGALNRWADPNWPHVELTTDHWDDDTLLGWLASNHLNCLFYDPNPGRGISSAVDWCVAAGRPLAITESEQFRHITGVLGTWPGVSLRESLTPTFRDDSMYPTQCLQREWSHANFIADYEGIIDALLGGGG
jgi:hypothetical protein